MPASAPLIQPTQPERQPQKIEVTVITSSAVKRDAYLELAEGLRDVMDDGLVLNVR